MESNGRLNQAYEAGKSDHSLPLSSTLELKSVDTLDLTKDEIRREIRSVKINLISVCCCILLVASSLVALVNSITSLLSNESLGITALAACGGVQLLTSAMLVSYTSKVWGIRKMVTVSMFLPIFFITSFFYPIPALIIPAGGLIGLSQALLISTTFMYGNGLGYWYAQLTKGNIDTILVVMSGMINSCLGGGFFLGNVLLYVILDPGPKIDSAVDVASENVSFEVCGGNYCNEDLSNMTTMQPPVAWRYYTMIGVFSGMALGGTLLSLFIRDFSKELGYSLRKKSEFCFMIKETWLLLKDPRGYLLIIITMFIGLEESFIMSDYTQAYISCVVGIPKVGLVMLAYGLSEIVVSVSQWVLSKLLGRIATILLAYSMLTGCFFTLLFWTPNPDQIIVLFAIVVLWGASDSILMSVVFSVYALLFEDNIEGSFSVGNFWWSLGFTLSFGWSQFLCIYVKLYILIAVGTAGLISYVLLEVLIRRKKLQKHEMKDITK